MTHLEEQAGIYGAELALFAMQHKIPPGLFAKPDNIGISAANVSDFSKMVRDEIAPNSAQLLCVEDNWRFRAIAALKGRVALYNLGFVNWVVTEEPRVDDLYETGIKRAEFYYPSLETARGILGNRAIRYSFAAEGELAYLKVKFGPPPGLEFRLTNTPLSKIAQSQIESEEAIVVNLRKK